MYSTFIKFIAPAAIVSAFFVAPQSDAAPLPTDQVSADTIGTPNGPTRGWGKRFEASTTDLRAPNGPTRGWGKRID